MHRLLDGAADAPRHSARRRRTPGSSIRWPFTREDRTKAEPQHERQWLEQLVGAWTYESEAIAEPGQAPVKYAGTEIVRSLDGVWVVCEGRGDMPDGGAQTTIMTLGYDPGKSRYVGTFVGSMMAYLWIYEGELGPAGKVLMLESEGPGYADEGRMARYRDTIEFESSDRRVQRSSFLGDDGRWHEFMTATYRRTKQRWISPCVAVTGTTPRGELQERVYTGSGGH